MRVVYSSPGGRYADNPRAIYEALAPRPGLTHLWLLDPARGGAPEGVPSVPATGPEAVAALEAADLVVAGTHIELEWRKRPGAVYLQTWHGAPLKRIHHDGLWAPPGLVARLSRDVARWDLLISPNAASTPILRAAFGFGGEILETGYPRTDALAGPGRDARRARVRAALGIPPDTRAVLYAPTFRDDVRFAGGGPDYVLHLDPERFARRHGRDHVLLLRLHPALTGRVAAPSHPAVRDVSPLADIRELHLAADVLVTDYSSAMFDFAVTGRPILLLAPDLDDYRDRLRGFYFDVTAVAPGPVLSSEAELDAALDDLAAVAAAHREAYAGFRTRFCHLDDGAATARVLDRLSAVTSTTRG